MSGRLVLYISGNEGVRLSMIDSLSYLTLLGDFALLQDMFITTFKTQMHSPSYCTVRHSFDLDFASILYEYIRSPAI